MNGDWWAPPPTGSDDTANLLHAISDCPIGDTLNLWGGCYSYSDLSIAGKPITLQGRGWTCKRDALGAFGGAGYALPSNFGGTLLRGNGLRVTSTETNKVHLKGFALVGPGRGSSTGLIYGDGAHALVQSDIDIGVMNFAQGVTLQFAEDLDARLIIRGCGTAVTAAKATNQNRFRLSMEACGDGYSDDRTCCANSFDNTLAQGNTGTSMKVIGDGNSLRGGYFENVAGVNALELSGSCNTAENPTLATLKDGILIDSGARVATIINPRASTAPIPFVDNGMGTMILGQTSNFAMSGTAVQQVLIDSYRHIARLPRMVA